MVLPARLSISISVLLTTHLAEGLNEIAPSAADADILLVGGANRVLAGVVLDRSLVNRD
jgi:hypothetical protein